MRNRTFFTTLMLFLVFFNLGIFIVSNTMLRDTIKRAEERSLGEHYFIVSALARDFHAVESRGNDITASTNSLLQSYNYLSGESKAGLALYMDNQLIYSNKNAEILHSNPVKVTENGTRLVTVQKSGSKTDAIVTGKLPVPYDYYTLIYALNITEAVEAWSQLKNILYLVGFVLSLLLAGGLLMVLNRIFGPLQQISQTSKDIAGGEYETRLPVKGHDELAKMAQSFNHMADEIQCQMIELKDAADRKQQFVDNFAHELRTPLTAIYGYAEYMQRAVLTEDDRLSALDYIMSESKRLQTISIQLLEMANLKNTQVVFGEIKVANLFEAVKRTMSGKLAGKDIQVEYRTEIDKIRGDASLLESLLVNLIDNGIKACGVSGHIEVVAEIRNTSMAISVTDNGKGMSSEILSQITEPFYRGDKARSRGDGGAGLGLAICKQIALSHAADLSFTSQPGKGTTAKVTFTTL